MMLVNVSSVQHGERRSEALIWWLCVDWNGRTFTAARRDPFEPNVFVRAKYRRAVSTTAVIGWKWIPKNLHHGQNSSMTSKRSGRRTNPLKRRPGLRSQLDAIPEEGENWECIHLPVIDFCHSNIFFWFFNKVYLSCIVVYSKLIINRGVMGNCCAKLRFSLPWAAFEIVLFKSKKDKYFFSMI